MVHLAHTRVQRGYLMVHRTFILLQRGYIVVGKDSCYHPEDIDIYTKNMGRIFV